MADIKNKNLLSDKGQELLKQRSDRLTNSSVQEVRILEKIAQDRAEIEKLSEKLNVDFDDKLKRITAISKRTEELKKALEIVGGGRTHGAEKAFRQATITMTGSTATSSDISAASRSSASLGPALTMAQGQSTGELENYIASQKSLLARQNERIRETSLNIEGNEGRFGLQTAARGTLVQNIGRAEAAMSAQKRLGVDTQSSYYNAVDVTARVRADQEKGQIQSGVASGQFGNRRAIEDQLDAAAKKLIATFDQLDSSVKSADKAEQAKAGALAKQFGDAKQDYERQKNILSEMGRQGGGPTALQTTGGIISNLGTIGMGISQGIRYAGVTSEMTQAQNRVGLVNQANQRFSDAYAATQGDMRALRRVLSNAHGEDVQRGLLMHGREDAAKLGETVSSGAKAVGATIDAAAGPGGIVSGIKGLLAGGPGGAAAGVITEGLAKATPDIQNFAFNAIDYGKQNTQVQAYLAAAQQNRSLNDAMNQISDFSSQAAADQQKSLTYSTRGLGVGNAGARYGAAATFTGSGALGVGTDLTVAASAGAGDVDYAAYKKAIMKQESSGRAGATNSQSSAYGLYQITNSTARGAGVDPASMRLTGNAEQDTVAIGNQNAAMYNLSMRNKQATRSMRDKFPQAAAGYTDEELMAGSHYAGAGGMRKFLAGGGDDTIKGINPGIASYIGTYRKNRGMIGTAGGAAGVPGLTTETTSGGGDRENVQALLSDPRIVSMIAQQAGLSTKDISKLAGMGTVGLGKEFARDQGRGAVSDITRAGELSRIGYTQSPEQYMQARSMMTGAGGGAKDFEEILKNAVANGMDTSKNIMEMVNATTSIASRSASAGINAFGGAAEGLGMGIDALRKTGVSENMATAAAANAANASEGMAGEKGADIANVIETARLRKSFGKAELWQLERMRTTSPAQARELKNLFKSGKSKEARDLAIRMGVGGEGGITDLSGAESLLEATSEQVTRRATGFGINPSMEAAIQEKRRSGKPLTERERSFVNATTALNVDSGVSGEALLGYNTTTGGARKGTLQSAAAGRVGGGEDQIRAGAMGDARVFEAGAANIVKALGGMEALGQTMMKVAAALKPEEMARGSQDAAGFKLPAEALGGKMTTLQNSIQDLTSAIRNEYKNMTHRTSSTSHTTPSAKDAKAIKELQTQVNQSQRGGRN